jgi:hypothetical protein
MAWRLLPWDYGVRNLFRRPSRSALTLGGLSIVVLLVLVVVGFIRGLEASLAATGRPNVMLVFDRDLPPLPSLCLWKREDEGWLGGLAR